MPRHAAACLSVALLAACSSMESPEPPPAAEAAASPVLPGPPPSTPPTSAARPAIAPPPAARPASPAASLPATKPRPAATSAKPAPPPADARPAPPRPALDLKSLESRLKQTPALGIFTKLALKNQIDDLVAELSAHHRGSAQSTLVQLRRSYELLLFKVLSMLEESDPPLASAIADSREAIWAVLSNPAKFSSVSAP